MAGYYTKCTAADVSHKEIAKENPRATFCSLCGLRLKSRIINLDLPSSLPQVEQKRHETPSLWQTLYERSQSVAREDVPGFPESMPRLIESPGILTRHAATATVQTTIPASNPHPGIQNLVAAHQTALGARDQSIADDGDHEAAPKSMRISFCLYIAEVSYITCGGEKIPVFERIVPNGQSHPYSTLLARVFPNAAALITDIFRTHQAFHHHNPDDYKFVGAVTSGSRPSLLFPPEFDPSQPVSILRLIQRIGIKKKISHHEAMVLNLVKTQEVEPPKKQPVQKGSKSKSQASSHSNTTQQTLEQPLSASQNTANELLPPVSPASTSDLDQTPPIKQEPESTDRWERLIGDVDDTDTEEEDNNGGSQERGYLDTNKSDQEGTEEAEAAAPEPGLGGEAEKELEQEGDDIGNTYMQKAKQKKSKENARKDGKLGKDRQQPKSRYAHLPPPMTTRRASRKRSHSDMRKE